MIYDNFEEYSKKGYMISKNFSKNSLGYIDPNREGLQKQYLMWVNQKREHQRERNR